jgi:hypothetical protein
MQLQSQHRRQLLELIAQKPQPQKELPRQAKALMALT